MGGYGELSSFCAGKKLAAAKTGDAMFWGWGNPSNANSGVIGEGVCMAVESEESLRTRRGVGGEPMGEEV
jgi:hypothetical protein